MIAADYDRHVDKLARLSVAKHYDAYQDVAWDAPEMALTPADPRFVLSPDDPLGATAWYRGLPLATQARIGLHTAACAMKIGMQFENTLKRGLLTLASTLPDGSPELRYLYHEVIEEAQHSLMFNEFIARARVCGEGFATPGLVGPLRFLPDRVIRLARRFPELFFIFVLAGEEPIDHVQRDALRDRELHPLLRRIIQIHVTEEARHLSFANEYLRRHVRELTPRRKRLLSIVAPFVLGISAHVMLRPGKHLLAAHHVPPDVIEEAYGKSSARYAKKKLESLSRVRDLCRELGLITPRTRRIWTAFGIHEASAS